MKKLWIGLLAGTPLLALAASMQTAELDVKNMTCPVCPITIRKALEKVPGVMDAKVDYASKTATVHFDPDKTNVRALLKATADAGFPSAVHSGGQK
jgi:mercuric ion binding protein